MPEQRPRVSVGIAVYKGEQYIADAIRSIQAQDYPDWEILVLNDASPDKSVAIVEAFNDQRIRILHNPTNEGLVAVRNRITDEARGEFLAWLDQDDLAAPNRLSTQLSYLRDNPHVSACGSNVGKLVEKADHSYHCSTMLLPTSHQAIRSAIPFMNPLASSTVTMRVSDFAAAGLRFRSKFGNSLDYDLWSRGSDRLVITNLPDVLGAHRFHAEQTSRGEALALMNRQALKVQFESIARNLGLSVTRARALIHRATTIAPLMVSDLNLLADISTWLRDMRVANTQKRAYDLRTFDAALSRQWLAVVRAARQEVAPHKLTYEAFKGAITIQARPSTLFSEVFKGIQRHLAAQ